MRIDKEGNRTISQSATWSMNMAKVIPEIVAYVWDIAKLHVDCRIKVYSGNTFVTQNVTFWEMASDHWVCPDAEVVSGNLKRLISSSFDFLVSEGGKVDLGITECDPWFQEIFQAGKTENCADTSGTYAESVKYEPTATMKHVLKMRTNSLPSPDCHRRRLQWP